MNREIKFRAKLKFNGVIGSDKNWIHSSFLNIRKDNEGVSSGLILGGQRCQLDTLGQYTGLNDKNGTEIYEEDIIKDHNGYIFKVEYKGGWYVGQPSLENDTPGYKSFEYFSTCEVIGNIHENKDLL